MIKPPGKRDIAILAVFVPLVTGVYLYAQRDLNAMQESLEDRAEIHRREWFAPEHTDRDDFYAVTMVDSHKTLTYFGEGRGMVHLFTMDKSDSTGRTLLGVEYHYVRRDGAWQETDSMRCDVREHYLDAVEQFRSRGVEFGTASSRSVREADNRGQ